MKGLYGIVQPFLMCLAPEKAHRLALKTLRAGLGPKNRQADDPVLRQVLWGVEFTNPVGLAAGFDKDAEVMGPMLDLGFGFVEAGTVTPQPQKGNPGPRIFRDPATGSIINRMGFPNKGLAAFKHNVEKFRRAYKGPGRIGLNIGKNKDTENAADDYALCAREVAVYADFLVINVSSPNTPGLRNLQQRAAIEDLVTAVRGACGTKPPPVVVKIAPDLTPPQRAELAGVALDLNLDGLAISNTTLDRPEVLPETFAAQQGGLSGPLLKDRSTDLIRDMYLLTEGRVPIIGIGGISGAADAYEKIRAGASLIQLYTALIYKGPQLVQDIKDGLASRLQADGFASLADAVGADANLKTAKELEQVHG